MKFKEKEETKQKMRVMCATCGKPVADDVQSGVTRFLFRESRCNCQTFTPVQERDDGHSELEKESAVDDPTIAENLGDRYEVLSLLGKGGMGAVYKVRDKVLDKVFAIKVLNKELVEDSTSIRRFQQEAQAASALTNPNLVAVYDFGVGQLGCPYMVMDYLDGQSLQDLLKKKGFLDAPEALDIFIQATEAISAAHERGVIHRDIKPSNIILLKGDNGGYFVKIVDFGVAKVLPSQKKAVANLTQTGDIFGSPLYMSPEQCQGNKQDARSDIYALGCVMYEALTGIQPFAAENPIKTILRHINDNPKPILSLPEDFKIPKDLDALIMRCLEKDPDHRIQTAKELLKNLELIRDSKKLHLKQIKKKAPISRGKMWFAAAAVGLSLGLVVTVFSVMDPKASGNKDMEAFRLFSQGKYEEAVPLLESCVVDYRPKVEQDRKDWEAAKNSHGSHRNEVWNRYATDECWMGDFLQHIGECYLNFGDGAIKKGDLVTAKAKFAQAAGYYEEALEHYKDFPKYGYVPKAFRNYIKVLEHLNRTADIEAARERAKSWGVTY